MYSFARPKSIMWMTCCLRVEYLRKRRLFLTFRNAATINRNSIKSWKYLQQENITAISCFRPFIASSFPRTSRLDYSDNNLHPSPLPEANCLSLKLLTDIIGLLLIEWIQRDHETQMPQLTFRWGNSPVWYLCRWDASRERTLSDESEW